MSQSSESFGYPGETPRISANGSSNGLVWVIEVTNTVNIGALHVYAADDLTQELYNSNQAGTRDLLDGGIKFSVPTVANGKVYVGTSSTLTVFGLLRSHRLATGADAGGGPEVTVSSDAGPNPSLAFFAYDPKFQGGVRVALGDVNGDGVPDIVTTPGPGGGPDIRVFDGNTGMQIREFMAYDPGFLGGVFVAAADVNHDGVADIITGADAGGGPEVKVFNGTNGAVLADFFAYDSRFPGGVRVAAGDVNGDGFADVVTGAGPGGGPHVEVFDGQALSRGQFQLLQSFMAYSPSFTGGVFVAAADTTGTGLADIITGAGAGGGPHVEVFRAADLFVLQSFMAYDPGFTGGVRVAAGNVDDADPADIITGAGPGGGPQVLAFDRATLAVRDSFFAYEPSFTGGVFVGGSG
jgi:hypothetical protein